MHRHNCIKWGPHLHLQTKSTRMPRRGYLQLVERFWQFWNKWKITLDQLLLQLCRWTRFQPEWCMHCQRTLVNHWTVLTVTESVSSSTSFSTLGGITGLCWLWQKGSHHQHLCQHWVASLDCVDYDIKGLIINIFVNVRLHHCLRENNRNLGSHKGWCNRKVMKCSHD